MLQHPFNHTLTAMAAFEEIPFEVFLSAILPCLSAVDVGRLAQVDTMWREFTGDSKVWKYLYLQLTPSKILDTSVHIGTKKNRLRDRQKEFDVWRATGAQPIIYHAGYPFVPESTKRCTNTEWFLHHSWCSDCMPKELKDTLKSWREIRTDGIDTEDFPSRGGMYPGLRNTESYCKYVNDSWRQYNREKGLSTVNLCQDPTHYATDTLGTLEDCKKKRSFKKATLQILAKKSKTELAKATREKKTKLRKLEKARHVFKQIEQQYIEAEEKEKQAKKVLESIQDGISLA